MTRIGSGIVLLALAFLGCERTRPEHSGLYPIVDYRRGAWGYIDQAGEVAIEPSFCSVGAFAEGLAPVAIGDGFWLPGTP